MIDDNVSYPKTLVDYQDHFSIFFNTSSEVTLFVNYSDIPLLKSYQLLLTIDIYMNNWTHLYFSHSFTNGTILLYLNYTLVVNETITSSLPFYSVSPYDTSKQI